MGSNRRTSTPERAIATVTPYNSNNNTNIGCGRNSCASSTPKTARGFMALSMDESGVFTDNGDTPIHQSTQTYVDDFAVATSAEVTLSSDLCAEIQKLNKFRKRIEECATKCTRPAVDVGILSPISPLDATRLQFYNDRLEQLEQKVAIYESTGDLQVRRLTTRLQKEIELESVVKQLRQRIDKLETINRQLDEERCELEEIENDTRFQLQRLEIEMEMLSQQNVELKMSQDDANEMKCRLIAIETERNELRRTIDLITTSMPSMLLFNAWQMQQQTSNIATSVETMSHSSEIDRCDCNQVHVCPKSERYVELLRREQELIGQIGELNRAYNETLERADNLWAQMEKEYKDKLARIDDDNQQLQMKIGQLEQRLQNDEHYAQERIAQLEDEENILKRRLVKVTKANRDDVEKYKTLQSDFHALNIEYERLKAHVDGPMTDALDKERRKSRHIEEEMRAQLKCFNDREQLHRNQMKAIQMRVDKMCKEMFSLEVNNNELKGEVLTLEHRIIELNKQRKDEQERVQAMIDDATRDNFIEERPIKPTRNKYNQRNLAQELATPFSNNHKNNLCNFNYTSVYSLNSVASKISDCVKTFEVRTLFGSYLNGFFFSLLKRQRLVYYRTNSF